MTTRFKIGDKVRLTGRGWADFEPTHQGDIVEITAIFAGDAIFRDDEGFEWFVDSEPGSEWEGTLVDA